MNEWNLFFVFTTNIAGFKTRKQPKCLVPPTSFTFASEKQKTQKLEERDKYRKQILDRYEKREAEMKALKGEMKKLAVRDKQDGKEMTEKDELMHNLFSYIQSNS